MIIVTIAVIAFMTVMAVICYAALIVASHADDIADKWHEEGVYGNTEEASNEGSNINVNVAPGSSNAGES